MVSRFKRQYSFFEMIALQKAATLLSLFIGVTTCAASARAEAPDKREKAIAPSTEPASPNDAAHPAPQNGDPADNQARPAKDDDFVDKDGDGIQDGKERRFRRRSKHRKDGGRHTGKQRRNRAQKGKPN